MKYYCVQNIKLSSDKEKLVSKIHPRLKKIIYGFDNLLEEIKEGDVVIFDNVTELDTTKKDNIEIIIENYNKLIKRNVELEFDRSSACDSAVISNYVLEMKEKGIDVEWLFDDILYLQVGAFINFRDSSANIKKYSQKIAHDEKGKSYGRPKGTTRESEKSKKTKEIILKYSKEFNGKLNDEECLKKCDASRNMFYIYKKQLKKEQKKK